jgi:ABC-type multidrug transport system fused ATPase/permease subunit
MEVMKILPRNLFSLIRVYLNVLSIKDKRRLLLTSVFQAGTSVLDVIGIAAIGVMGAISLANIDTLPTSNQRSGVAGLFKLENLSYQGQMLTFGLIAMTCFLSRTIMSVVLTKKILFFMSRRGSSISSELVKDLLSEPLLELQKKSTQEKIWQVTRGVEIIVLEVIAPSAVLFSDLVLLVLMLVTLFVLNPLTALSTLLLFGLTGFFLNSTMKRKSEDLGLKLQTLNIESNEKIAEVFNSYREATVRNRQHYYAEQIRKLRFGLADITAEVNFMPLISKYTFEFVVILGAVAVCAYQFTFNDIANAIATMTVFLAASSRIAPAVLRVQQGSLQIRRGMSTSKATLQLIQDFKSYVDQSVELVKTEENFRFDHIGFDPHIQIRNAVFNYPGRNLYAVSGVSFTFPAGKVIAIVGPSGSGKTTLVDLLLGILEPDSGTIFISGIKPKNAILKWPGAIAYVPQDIVIADATLLENITLGFPGVPADSAEVQNALKLAQLEEYIAGLPEGIYTKVGERGSSLSGGQRQRLGIARALFTNPKLIVLDEATSALDIETELKLADALKSLRGKSTVIMIAHKLNTVRNADLILYMENGALVKSGSFEEILSAIPNFASQSNLIVKNLKNDQN